MNDPEHRTASPERDVPQAGAPRMNLREMPPEQLLARFVNLCLSPPSASARQRRNKILLRERFREEVLRRLRLVPVPSTHQEPRA